MSSTTSNKSVNEDGQGARFAVVRLKPGDNLLGLFQLLIQHGFGEVSFVNNLNETIFPIVGSTNGKNATSPAPAPVPSALVNVKNGESTHVASSVERISAISNNDRMSMEKSRQHMASGAPGERYQLPQQQQTQIRTTTAELLYQQKANNESTAALNEDLVNRKSTTLNLNLLQASSTANSLPAFAAAGTAMPTNFLGLPTMPNLNTSAAAAAAIAALSEAATPPYSLANFFAANNLSTTAAASATGLIPPSTNSVIHQYSPAILAAAAVVQQQRQAAATVAATASTAASQARSPTIQTLLNHASIQQPQQRFPIDQHLKQQQLQPFATLQQHQRISNGPQQSKNLSQKSPAASPGSSSGSSSYSNQSASASGGPYASMPPGIATTQLRQRGQRTYAEDPSLYVSCRLCKNKIMGSRISNLTNHVRRHSSMKQFQCCYCDYTHNEMAKVRLHMLHNHKDKDSQPIDNLSPEMQASWDLLMKECFPDHCQPGSHHSTSSSSTVAVSSAQQVHGLGSIFNQRLHGQQQLPSASVMAHRRAEITLDEITLNAAQNLNRLGAASNGTSLQGTGQPKKFENDLQVLIQRRETENSTDTSPMSSTSPVSATGRIGSLSPGAVTPPAVDVNQLPPMQQQQMARCVECGAYVNSKLKARHIRKCHLQYLLPFACSMCGYDHSEHSKVKVHICLKHDDSPMAQVVTRDLSTYAEQLVPEYFPNDQQAVTNIQQTTAVVDNAAPANGVMSKELMNGHVKESVIIYGPNQPITNAIQVQHETLDTAKCDLCRRKVPVASLVRHARRHLMANTIYNCAICGHYETSSRLRIRRHLKLKHSKIGKDAKSAITRRCGGRPISMGVCSSGGSGLVERIARRCFQAANSNNIQRRVRKFVKAYFQSNRRREKSTHLGHANASKSAKNKQRGIRHPRSSMSGHSTNKQQQETLDNGMDLHPTPVMPSVVKMETDTKSTVDTVGTNSSSSMDLYRMCPLCAHWIRSDQLTAHLQTHVPPIGPTYRCNLCEFTSVDPLIIRGHFIETHQQKMMVQTKQEAHASPESEKQHQTAAMILTYANLCRSSAATAAADG